MKIGEKDFHKLSISHYGVCFGSVRRLSKLVADIGVSANVVFMAIN